MRRWIIIAALGTNALLSLLVLLKLWYQAGWGSAVRLSAAESRLLIVVAVAALAGTMLLVPVLGLSFWARDRGTHRLEERLAAAEHQHQPDGSSSTVEEGSSGR